jgi:hypothetical protein
MLEFWKLWRTLEFEKKGGVQNKVGMRPLNTFDFLETLRSPIENFCDELPFSQKRGG